MPGRDSSSSLAACAARRRPARVPVGRLRPWPRRPRPGPSRDIAFAPVGTAGRLSAGSAPRHACVTVDGCGFGTPTGKARATRRTRTTRPGGPRRGEPGFALTELVASWSAATPGDSWVEVEVRGRTAGRHVELGRARPLGRGRPARAADPRTPARPTTWPRSTWTPGGSPSTPAWRRTSSGCGCYRTRWPTGPTVSTVGAVASRLPRGTPVAVSKPGPGVGHRAGRAALLPDGALRPLPAVRRRRRGLVLADLDVDGARLLRRAAAPRGLPGRCRPATPTRGSTTPPG